VIAEITLPDCGCPNAAAPAPKAKKGDEKSDAHHDEHHSHQVTEPVADAP
jgi:hypothetical protein